MGTNVCGAERTEYSVSLWFCSTVAIACVAGIDVLVVIACKYIAGIDELEAIACIIAGFDVHEDFGPWCSWDADGAERTVSVSLG